MIVLLYNFDLLRRDMSFMAASSVSGSAIRRKSASDSTSFASARALASQRRSSSLHTLRD